MGAKCLYFVQVGADQYMSWRVFSDIRSNGCGIDIGVKQGKVVGVRGRAADRVNKGRLGPKGLHGYVVFVDASI